MERTAVFTITADKGTFNIKSNRYKAFNQYGISKECLFTAMTQLADVFNNVLGIGICFEVE